jgi:hypothetical protein
VTDDAWSLRLDGKEPLRDAMGRIGRALVIAERGMNGDVHYKQWVIDQMVRMLTGIQYNVWKRYVEMGPNALRIYHWDKGIGP